jgi:hypothetical protein
LVFSCCDSVAALPALANCDEHRGAAGNGPGTTIKYLRRTTSGAAGNGLGTTAKYLRQTTIDAAGNGLGAAIKYLRRTTSGGAGYGLSTTIKYLLGTTAIGLGTTIEFLRRTTSAANALIMFGVAARYRRATAGSRQDDAKPDNSALHTGAARPAPA